jgi:hypothetical protein
LNHKFSPLFARLRGIAPAPTFPPAPIPVKAYLMITSQLSKKRRQHGRETKTKSAMIHRKFKMIRGQKKDEKKQMMRWCAMGIFVGKMCVRVIKLTSKSQS